MQCILRKTRDFYLRARINIKKGKLGNGISKTGKGTRSNIHGGGMTCCISISARSIREPNASKTIESAIGTSTIYDPKEDGRQGRKLEGKGRREDMNTFFLFLLAIGRRRGFMQAFDCRARTASMKRPLSIASVHIERRGSE